jgi:small subunit ribosomal protein S1
MSTGGNQSNDDEDFAALLAEYDQKAPPGKGKGKGGGRGPSTGDLIKGKIVRIGSDSVFVELGAKAEGILDLAQVIDAEGKPLVKVGDEIEARVVDTRGGFAVLRVKMGRGPEARAELVQAFEHQIPVEGLVTEVVKGGLSVDIAGVRGFCPASQIDNRFVEDLAVYVGQRLQFRITKYELGRGDSANLVLSRRVLVEAESAKRAVATRAALAPGAVMRGTVTNLMPYGAFVDLGGVEGMIHVSELGFSRVDHPKDVLTTGQTVEVVVLKVEATTDPKKPEKVALSLKALEKDPWQEIAATLREGMRRTGTVVRLQTFGAFVEIAPGIEGLVHISELGAGRRINHPKEVVKVGQSVEVTILRVDPEARRIALSLAQAGEGGEDEPGAPAPVAQAPAKLGTFADLLNKKK